MRYSVYQDLVGEWYSAAVRTEFGIFAERDGTGAYKFVRRYMSHEGMWYGASQCPGRHARSPVATFGFAVYRSAAAWTVNIPTRRCLDARTNAACLGQRTRSAAAWNWSPGRLLAGYVTEHRTHLAVGRQISPPGLVNRCLGGGRRNWGRRHDHASPPTASWVGAEKPLRPSPGLVCSKTTV